MLTFFLDFDIQNGAFTVEGVLQSWEFILGNASQLDTGFIALQHDLYQQSVEVATGYILPDAIAQNFDIGPVISCLNQPLENSYIETNDNSTNPPVAEGEHRYMFKFRRLLISFVGSGVVTLTSGAPGSAEQTGSSGSGGDSDGTVGLNAMLGAAALACAAGGALMLLDIVF